MVLGDEVNALVLEGTALSRLAMSLGDGVNALVLGGTALSRLATVLNHLEPTIACFCLL